MWKSDCVKLNYYIHVHSGPVDIGNFVKCSLAVNSWFQKYVVLTARRTGVLFIEQA